MAARSSYRTKSQTRKVPTMRPLSTVPRQGPSRSQTPAPAFNGRASPAESMVSSRSRTPKRKAGAMESDQDAHGGETNINVVVRCRGRSDREVRENSATVVSADGINGKEIQLSMGPNALSKKVYQFDKVFSSAADQQMVFDEVVAPILDEVLNGFNCTIFAYGQTGTGKTYTMSGDISDSLPVPEAAGIIPRVLHHLFDKINNDDSIKSENTVKCSFIELYNEELRDLLAADENTKLKIFDETNKSGRTTNLVQGMEETFINNASKGIQLLRNGSHKRQVAATKCNDLSSRSHTVFTITVFTKTTSESGQEVISSGKLNLVDLAGSENIQRSGAENKRATEAGLINKSLLTLGRVINALVDRSSHIPYRESKLTRLLQDSLGGKTKTCIIATLSPAKSNLEETISTLDYAFRAKNIRNKPQINPSLPKMTLLREFTSEIEKLRSELIATRQRNGVYLTAETYEEIHAETESLRILSQEQREKIENTETNLRNKIQEVFNIQTSFQNLKKDHEQTKASLDSTNSVLAKTEIVLEYTRRNLVEETCLREAHAHTEEQLVGVGKQLLGTLDTTTDHVHRLHSKLKRRSDLQTINRVKWADSQNQVAKATLNIDDRIESLRSRQEGLIASLSERMQTFVSNELQELQGSQDFLKAKAAAFEASQSEVEGQTKKAKENMNQVLEEIGDLRESVKEKVGTGLNDLSVAAHRISAGIATELSTFHGQLENSYVSLGREFKTLFEDLIRRLGEQQVEADKLRQQIVTANRSFVEAGQSSQVQFKDALDKEREVAAKERESLLTHISSLITRSAATQEARIGDYLESANKRVKTSEHEYRMAQQLYEGGMDMWAINGQGLIDSSVQARDMIKTKLQADWNSANEQTENITATTNAVYDETVRIVDGQMAQMDNQLVALDEIVSRVQAQNEDHHRAHAMSLTQLAEHVQESYRNIGDHLETSYNRTTSLDADMQDRTNALTETLPALASEGEVRQPLNKLRDEMHSAQIAEYATTGETPARVQYSYPKALPRTESHETLLNRVRGVVSAGPARSPTKTPFKSPRKRSPMKPKSSPVKYSGSPTKTSVFADIPPMLTLTRPASAPVSHPVNEGAQMGLRELDVNTASAGVCAATTTGTKDVETEVRGKQLSASMTGKPVTNALFQSQIESKQHSKRMTRSTMMGGGAVEKEKENFSLSASVGPGIGRRLRSRGSD